MQSGGPDQMGLAFPKPGPALKVILAVIAVVGIGSAIAVHSTLGKQVFLALACSTDAVLHGEVWRLVTAGVLTAPSSLSHLLMTLVGLYFLSPDLERRWGTGRFVRFILIATLAGFGLEVAFDRFAPDATSLFHPDQPVFGASSAMTAIAIAWSMMHSGAQVRLFFVLPVSGRALFWVTIGFCVLGLIYGDTFTEGAIAPFGGVLTGILLGGTPSTLRATYLRVKLAMLRGRGDARGRTPTAAEILRGAGPKGAPPRRPGSPPLRVVHGGLEEELTKRKPPKDKRYLN